MILGITGGVGAGKSSVLAILEKEYNAKLILADEVGRELMQPGEANYVNIVNAFGKEILNEDQTIDTKKLAAIAFSNPLETLRLNAITHPNVRVRIEWMIKEIRDKEPDALIVIEAALLSEGHLIPLCDDVWYIYTDEQIRIKRIMESRGYSKERCLQTIARQKSDAQFRAECRVVIDNSHSIEETKAQIERHAYCRPFRSHPGSFLLFSSPQCCSYKHPPRIFKNDYSHFYLSYLLCMNLSIIL